MIIIPKYYTNSRLVSEPSSKFQLLVESGSLAADCPLNLSRKFQLLSPYPSLVLATYVFLHMLGKLNFRGFQQFGNFAHYNSISVCTSELYKLPK